MITTSVKNLYEMAAEVGLQRYNTKKGYVAIDINDLYNFPGSDKPDSFISPSDSVELLRREISAMVVPPTFQVACLRGLNLLDLCSLLNIVRDIFPLHKTSRAQSISRSIAWSTDAPPTLHLASYMGFPLATCVHFISSRSQWFFMPAIFGSILFIIKGVLSFYHPPESATKIESILDAYSTLPPSTIFDFLRDFASVLSIAASALLTLFISHHWPVLATSLNQSSRALSDLSLPVSSRRPTNMPNMKEELLAACTFFPPSCPYSDGFERLVQLRLVTNLCALKESHPLPPPCELAKTSAPIVNLFTLFDRVQDGTYHREQERAAKLAWLWVAIISISSLVLHYCWTLSLPYNCSFVSMLAASLLQAFVHQVVRRVVASIAKTKVAPALRTHSGVMTSSVLISDGIPLVTFLLAAALSSSPRIAGCTIVTNVIFMMAIKHRSMITQYLKDLKNSFSPSKSSLSQNKKSDDVPSSANSCSPHAWVERASEESNRPILSVDSHLGYASSQLLMTLAGATVCPPILVLSYFDTKLALESIRREIPNCRRSFNTNADTNIITWCLDISLSFVAAGSALVLSVATPLSTFTVLTFEHCLLMLKGGLLLLKHILPGKSLRISSSSSSNQSVGSSESEELFCFEGLFFPQPRILLSHALVDKPSLSSPSPVGGKDNGYNQQTSFHQNGGNTPNAKIFNKKRSVYKHVSIATSCSGVPPQQHSVHFRLNDSSNPFNLTADGNRFVFRNSVNRPNDEEDDETTSAPASPVKTSPTPKSKHINLSNKNTANLRLRNADSSASTVETLATINNSSAPPPPLPILKKSTSNQTTTAGTTSFPVSCSMETPRMLKSTPADVITNASFSSSVSHQQLGSATPCVRQAEVAWSKQKRKEAQQLRRLQRLKELRLLCELCNEDSWIVDSTCNDNDQPSAAAFSLLLSLKGIGWLKRSTMSLSHPSLKFEMRGSARKPILACTHDYVMEDIKFEMPLKCSSSNISSTGSIIDAPSVTRSIVHDASGAVWAVNVEVTFVGKNSLLLTQISRSAKGVITEKLKLSFTINEETNEIENKKLVQNLHVQPLGAVFHTAVRSFVPQKRKSSAGKNEKPFDVDAFVLSDLSPAVSTISSIKQAFKQTNNNNTDENGNNNNNSNPFLSSYMGIERVFIPDALLEYFSSDEEEDDAKDEFGDTDPKIKKIRGTGLQDAVKIRGFCDSGFSQQANGFTNWGSGKYGLQIFKKDSPGGKPLISIGEIRIPSQIKSTIENIITTNFGNAANGNSSIPSVVSAICDIIWDVDAKAKYDPMMKYQLILQEANDLEVVYQTFHGVCGCAGRDMIIKVIRERVSNKRHVIAVSSIAWPNQPDFDPTCERATVYLGGFDILEDDQSGSSDVLIRLINQADLGGALPDWVQKVGKLDSMKGLGNIVAYLESELKKKEFVDTLVQKWKAQIKAEEEKKQQLEQEHEV
eukprot:GDKJ01014368.1.p1 GENE.GDKJ01014368.1~~GDKJ01014368.1.p1  ORF type:complete len:1529 (-),score=390.98 GDKJ01014368.1:399-4754(-)